MTVDFSRLQTYSELLQAVQPRMVRTEEDAALMNDVVDLLTDRPHLSDDQREFIGLLGQLIYDWESEHEAPIDVSPQEVVSSLLLENGLRQVDLVGPVFPSPSTVSDFLHNRRALSYERVTKLAAFFRVSPALFYPAGEGGRPRVAAPSAGMRAGGASGEKPSS
jgi:HTH-type transcriptional regulator / antitoxin HigA